MVARAVDVTALDGARYACKIAEIQNLLSQSCTQHCSTDCLRLFCDTTTAAMQLVMTTSGAASRRLRAALSGRCETATGSGLVSGLGLRARSADSCSA